MTKIIFLIDSLQQGGMEKQLIYLVNAFSKKTNYKIQLATFNPVSKLNFYSELLNPKIEVIDLSINQKITIPGFSFIANILLIAKKISYLKGNSYVAFGVNSSLILELAKLLFLSKKTTALVSERNTDLLPLSMKRRFFLSCHSLATYIVPNSHSQGRIINKVFPLFREKIKVINNFIDTDHFYPKSYSHSKDSLKILVLGRLTEQKNPLVLIAALKHLKKSGYSVNVTWYGRIQDVKLYNTLRKEIFENNLNFEINAPDPNTLKIYHSHDIICLPSFYEGFPNVLGEAIACGLPAIVSYEAGDASMMVKENINGYLFHCENEKELYFKILKFINLNNQTKIKFGKESRKIAEKLFKEDLFFEAYHKLLF